MVVLGRIVAPYGIQGWVKIHPFGDDPAAWRQMEHLWLGASAEGAEWQPYGLKGFRPQGSLWVAKLEGVDDRNGAELLEGRFVGAPRTALPRAAADEFYWADLVGLAVENLRGEALGTVASLLESGANHVLVLRDGEVERLLPFVAAVVKDVDVAGGRIRVEWEKDW
jgi:16S rRNA processing protein RimM